MKALTLVAISSLFVLSSAFAKDPIKTLSCLSDTNVKSFNVTLDPGSYDEGSGYFHPINAALRDNYYTTDEMVCVGARPAEIVCMGYLNGISETIIEARTHKEGKTILLQYTTLRGNGPEETTLKCKLQ